MRSTTPLAAVSFLCLGLACAAMTTACASRSTPDSTAASSLTTQLEDLNCEAWEKVPDMSPGRISLASASEGNKRYLVGSTQSDLVRFLVGIENDKVLLGIRNQQTGEAVSRAFALPVSSASSSNAQTKFDLQLASASASSTKKVFHELSCRLNEK